MDEDQHLPWWERVPFPEPDFTEEELDLQLSEYYEGLLRLEEEREPNLSSDAFRQKDGIYAASFDVPGPFAFNENWQPAYVSPDKEPETVISFTSNILRLKRAKVPGEGYQSHGKRGRQPRSRFDRNTPRRLSVI
jgi:hypothetical protein